MRLIKKKTGFTLIELITIIVAIGILVFVALPRFIDISSQSEESAENDMVGHVRTGIDLIYAENSVKNGGNAYPDSLDDADTGQSGPGNEFFGNVLQEAYNGSDWTKDASGNYSGPAGGTYSYDPATGQFSKITAD